MKTEKLNEILESHLLWLNNEGGNRANLRDANLRNADLRNANLRNANLRDADICNADLRNANLRNADLRDAENIPEYIINLFKKDMLYVLMHSVKEVPFLKKKLLSGEINGTQYEGECCCLVGTLAKADGGMENFVSQIPFYEKGLKNPCEQLFFQIQEGDTPENNQFAKIALDVIEYFEKSITQSEAE
jgi:hypothetical protein